MKRFNENGNNYKDVAVSNDRIIAGATYLGCDFWFNFAG